MISLMLSLFMLLPTSIIANSTTQNCRQSPFFNRLRKRNRVPPKTNQFDPFLQAGSHQFLTPKEHVFDMPFPAKYRSTGRPPGNFHIRHSLKEITVILEFPHPLIDIFSIETNNNNNYINYIDNGGNAVPAGNGNYSNTNVVGHRSNRIAAAGLLEWFANRLESNRCNYNYKYKYKFNIDGIPTTTTIAPATPATATINYKTSAEGISNEDGKDAEALGLSGWFTDQIESNCRNNNNNNGSNSTSTTDTTTTTPATATVNYKTSAEGISDEDGEAGLSEGSTERIESNRCNLISNNSNSGSISTSTSTTNKDNYNETFHHFFLFKLISLYLIITKSFSSREFVKESKEKHHHQQQQQQHYHRKQRYQFRLEQQQNHQHFKQQHHNMERMVTSIVLKLSLVAWDMWAFRNVF